MKQLSLLGFAGVLAILLAGCPVYEDGDGAGCVDQGCGDTDRAPRSCLGPQDCGANETCGDDSLCHVGDCTFWGCSKGFACQAGEDHTVSCVPADPGGDVIWCANPDDCAVGETCAPDGTCKAGSCDQLMSAGDQLGCIYGFICVSDGATSGCQHENPAACGADVDCAGFGPGYLCVSGICTAPADQCFDQTQCAAGSKCVAGKCSSACGTATCPASYTCSTEHGLCSIPAKPCAITNDCGGPDAVCVDGACVPRSDGPNCATGTVWVENGCIPSQSPEFVCNQDGVQDVCAEGSVCLHHSCYISCEGANANACVNQTPSLNQCKTVTTVSGSHKVCGSSENLGNECDPLRPCEGPGKMCIDGFCK